MNCLTFIVAEMMREDVSSLEMLKNNAKTIGGVLGAEEAFMEGKKGELGNEMFVDKQKLELQNITWE